MQAAFVGLLLCEVAVALAGGGAGECEFPVAAGRSERVERVERGGAGGVGTVEARDAGVRLVDVVQPAAPRRLCRGGDTDRLAGSGDPRAAERLDGGERFRGDLADQSAELAGDLARRGSLAAAAGAADAATAAPLSAVTAVATPVAERRSARTRGVVPCGLGE